MSSHFSIFHPSCFSVVLPICMYVATENNSRTSFEASGKFCTVLGNSFNNYNNVLFNNPVEGASKMQYTRMSPLSLYPQVLNSPPCEVFSYQHILKNSILHEKYCMRNRHIQRLFYNDTHL